MEFQQQSPGNYPFDGNTLWTMACGTMGGIYKLQSSPELLVSSLTLDGTLSVAIYAFVSAIVGYGGKKLIDYLFAQVRKNER
jgi:hypothetical protein